MGFEPRLIEDEVGDARGLGRKNAAFALYSMLDGIADAVEHGDDDVMARIARARAVAATLVADAAALVDDRYIRRAPLPSEIRTIVDRQVLEIAQAVGLAEFMGEARLEWPLYHLPSCLDGATREMVRDSVRELARRLSAGEVKLTRG